MSRPRTLRVLLVSGLVGTLGAGLLHPILPTSLSSRGLDLGAIGQVYTLGSLLPVIAQPVLGALSDRYGRKGFVLGLSLGTSLLVPLLALLEAPALLAAALALKLLLVRSAAPLTNALVADHAPADRRATVFARLDSATNLTFVVALLASAPVVGWLGSNGVFVVAGALFCASSLALLGLREAPRDVHGVGTQAGGSWRMALAACRAPFALLQRHPPLTGLFLYQFCFTFALSLFPAFLPLLAVQLGASQATVGPLVALSWLLYALVQPLGGRLSDRLASRNLLVVLGLGGMVPCSLLVAASGWMAPRHGLAVMVLGWALLAVPDGLFRPAAQAWAAELAPREGRGGFLGALGAVAALAQVVAPISCGALANRLGLGTAFLLAPVALLLAMVGVLQVPERPLTAVPLLARPPSRGLQPRRLLS